MSGGPSPPSPASSWFSTLQDTLPTRTVARLVLATLTSALALILGRLAFKVASPPLTSNQNFVFMSFCLHVCTILSYLKPDIIHQSEDEDLPTLSAGVTAAVPAAPPPPPPPPRPAPRPGLLCPAGPAHHRHQQHPGDGADLRLHLMCNPGIRRNVAFICKFFAHPRTSKL